jgi:hypothetical protein
VPELTIEELTLALAVVAGVAVVGLLTSLLLALRLRRVRKMMKIVRGDGEERDILSTLGSWSRNLDDINARVGEALEGQRQIRDKTRIALQKFHLVRYDAFEDMGGRLSFSAALLDDNGDGFVITSINGRTETRTYAKPVKNLSSEHNLSEEEGEAIAGAVAGRGDWQAPAESR